MILERLNKIEGKMHKMEYEVEDMKNKSKAQQLRNLIKMLNSKMLEDFDDHEDEEKKLSDEVDETGVMDDESEDRDMDMEMDVKKKPKAIDFKMEMIKADGESKPEMEMEEEEIDPEEMKEMMRKYFTERPRMMDKKTKIVTLPTGLMPGKRIEFDRKK